MHRRESPAHDPRRHLVAAETASPRRARQPHHRAVRHARQLRPPTASRPHGQPPVDVPATANHVPASPPTAATRRQSARVGAARNQQPEIAAAARPVRQQTMVR